MVDKYSNYDDLNNNEEEGDDYRIRWQKGDSGVAIIAIHGGGIERGTTEIAESVAGSQYSFYTFEGLKSTGNRVLHITSTRFNEPLALKLVKKASKVVAIHGCKGDTEEIIYMGGLDKKLKQKLSKSLTAAGFEAQYPQNSKLKGKNSHNICNRGQTRKGVQLEITRKLRYKLQENANLNLFVTALRDALSQ